MTIYIKLSCEIFGGFVYTAKVTTNMELNSFNAKNRRHLAQVNFHKYKCEI